MNAYAQSRIASHEREIAVYTENARRIKDAMHTAPVDDWPDLSNAYEHQVRTIRYHESVIDAIRQTPDYGRPIIAHT